MPMFYFFSGVIVSLTPLHQKLPTLAESCKLTFEIRYRSEKLINPFNIRGLNLKHQMRIKCSKFQLWRTFKKWFSRLSFVTIRTSQLHGKCHDIFDANQSVLLQPELLEAFVITFRLMVFFQVVLRQVNDLPIVDVMILQGCYFQPKVYIFYSTNTYRVLLRLLSKM